MSPDWSQATSPASVKQGNFNPKTDESLLPSDQGMLSDRSLAITRGSG
jgi:hypothetical protein